MISSNPITITTEDRKRCAEISARIPGWSGPTHYAFFRDMLTLMPIQSILVLGVYHGRDLAFIEDAQKKFRPDTPVKLVGVDLFSSGPCADWPEKDRDKTWQQLGFGPNPDAEAAQKNAPGADIVAADSVRYMLGCGQRFDLIYFDTSHDYNTLHSELSMCRHCCNEETLLAGDDYADQPGWGVIPAVKEAFSDFQIYPPIWLSSYRRLTSSV